MATLGLEKTDFSCLTAATSIKITNTVSASSVSRLQIASRDTVLRSAEHRDRISKETEALAFEMEGAGVWEVVPALVVKGVCDHADPHKDKSWQNYAAATEAAAAKAILEMYTHTDRGGSEIEEADQQRSESENSMAVFNGQVNARNIMTGSAFNFG